jgi:hypothetical protein
VDHRQFEVRRRVIDGDTAGFRNQHDEQARKSEDL